MDNSRKFLFMIMKYTDPEDPDEFVLTIIAVENYYDLLIERQEKM